MRFFLVSVSENNMIDTHCHINDELYLNNPKQYIDEASTVGVSLFLIPGFDLKSSRIAVDFSEKHMNCYAAIGIHPSEINKEENSNLDELMTLAKSKKVIAVGEIGLDYYWDKDPVVKEKQKEVFIKQINIANELDLPICIHCRDAINECLKILKENPVKRGGIMHCYAGSLEIASEFIKLGFLLGIGGTVTFKNAVTPKEVAANVPSTSYVLETDAPYLTPEPYRGKPNHSKYLCYIRNKIAELRNISQEQVEKETTENFKRVFDV